MGILKNIISFPLSVIQNFFFGLTLVIFDILQRISRNLFGYATHKKTVDWMTYLILFSLRFVGTKIKFHAISSLPKDVPLIIVSNHQSFFDLPPIGWFFRKHHPKYVSKIELGKGIPGISYNLKHGGSVLINRKDAKQSITALTAFGKYIEKNNYAAIIFPEGTRSKDGIPKPFLESGLKILIKYVPSAYIVPLTINNAWKISVGNSFFRPLGITISITVHEPIAANSMPFDDLFKVVEERIKSTVTVI
ncbi:MAG: lysophospholipid acyltransferase family protein [Flavobacteriaceae bacterium]|nr:lysophospholipid acyltransferase family protein [Flavobacteriaceae bacterium]